MFDKLIEIALKSALENPEIKEKLRKNNQKNKIIDLDKNSYKVLNDD